MKMDATQHSDFLAHYGILRKSGRYPWGSGQNPLQRSKTFLDIVDQHKKVDKMTESQIAKAYSDPPDHPFTVADLRALKSRAVNEVKQDQIRQTQRLKDKGMSNSEIGRRMGLNESTVRSLLEPGRQDRLDVLQSTADMLKRQVEEKKFVDVGVGVERDLPINPENPGTSIGISPDKFNTAISMLKEEGYSVHPLMLKQQGTGEMTRYKVLVAPGVTKKDVFNNRENIRLIAEKTDDRGHTWTDFGIQPPLSINPKRVGIRYKEDGGADADGVIYVRPGVSDISLGKSRYAQVRVAVGGTHYLKGMAVYKNDLPDGVDLQFNTNKSNTGNKFDAMKPLKRVKETGEIDPDNPFGAVIKKGGQLLDEKGKVSSVMNKVNEEGDWNEWSRSLSRQVLSKQSPDLIKSQLDLTYDRRVAEFEEIKGLTNPQVKRKLLESFGDETDSAAVHLKAAAMPRQATKVLLPSNDVKPHEIYAPTFRDGERVALVRFPHAGTFEIPELTVNNRNRKARALLDPSSPDAVLIHPKVAHHLSGADFDGDSVVVIPNNRGSITKSHPLDKLKDFDPQEYQVPLGPKTKKYPDGTPTISPSTKQQEMGNVTNLIADMTLRGANSDELSRAVRHSMVVIDSEKHNLDYKASARDHGISDLKRRYQGLNAQGGLAGASTLITRATAQTHVDNRKAVSAKTPGVTRTRVGTIDNKTGEKRTVETGEANVRYEQDGKKVTKSFRSREEAEQFVRDKQPNGEVSTRTTRSKKLAETKDAFSLVSEGRGTTQEQYYAEHSNRLKSLANASRLELITTKPVKYSPSAKKVYSEEVRSLNIQLDKALRNAPLERQAQVVAQRVVAQRKRSNPDMDKADLKKIKGQALDEARVRTGAKKHRIDISDREWEAIQAGAFSSSTLEKILNNTDLEKIRARATPRINPVMTPVMTQRAKQMLASGFSLAEVSDHLGIALSTLNDAVAKEVS